jgi:quercetin dioxygenase-like cupin family protein
MTLLHAKPGEVIYVSPLGTALANTKTETLIKTNSLEVIRIVMTAGKNLPPHAVAGEITVQCLEGRVEFRVGKVRHELTAGTLLFVTGGEEHSLHAIENSSVLVTILLAHKGLAKA